MQSTRDDLHENETKEMWPILQSYEFYYRVFVWSRDLRRLINRMELRIRNTTVRILLNRIFFVSIPDPQFEKLDVYVLKITETKQFQTKSVRVHGSRVALSCPIYNHTTNTHCMTFRRCYIINTAQYVF